MKTNMTTNIADPALRTSWTTRPVPEKARVPTFTDDRVDRSPRHVQLPLFARQDLPARRIASATDAEKEVLYFLGTDYGKQLVAGADAQQVRGCMHIAGNLYLVSTEDPNASFLAAMFLLPKWEFIVDPAAGRVTSLRELSLRKSLSSDSLQRDPVRQY